MAFLAPHQDDFCDRPGPVTADGREPEAGPVLRHRERGFTLIETLVAVSILAISLVVILQLFSGGLKSNRLSDDYTRGVFYAREKMDEILLAQNLSEGVIGGRFDDGYAWRAEARSLAIPEAKDVRLPFRAFNIKVEVLWDAGGTEKQFAVHAVKLVAQSQDSL